ncbi:MAG: hypothetical protein KAG96_01100 [Ichthyobacteriaceae bacterium]|nr:hypothetical protein [Ichthyobacteriaceae bacterium]
MKLLLSKISNKINHYLFYLNLKFEGIFWKSKQNNTVLNNSYCGDICILKTEAKLHLYNFNKYVSKTQNVHLNNKSESEQKEILKNIEYNIENAKTKFVFKINKADTIIEHLKSQDIKSNCNDISDIKQKFTNAKLKLASVKNNIKNGSIQQSNLAI